MLHLWLLGRCPFYDLQIVERTSSLIWLQTFAYYGSAYATTADSGGIRPILALQGSALRTFVACKTHLACSTQVQEARVSGR